MLWAPPDPVPSIRVAWTHHHQEGGGRACSGPGWGPSEEVTRASSWACCLAAEIPPPKCSVWGWLWACRLGCSSRPWFPSRELPRVGLGDRAVAWSPGQSAVRSNGQGMPVISRQLEGSLPPIWEAAVRAQAGSPQHPHRRTAWPWLRPSPCSCGHLGRKPTGGSSMDQSVSPPGSPVKTIRVYVTERSNTGAVCSVRISTTHHSPSVFADKAV